MVIIVNDKSFQILVNATTVNNLTCLRFSTVIDSHKINLSYCHFIVTTDIVDVYKIINQQIVNKLKKCIYDCIGDRR
jgi:hypothetical protein